MGGEQNEAPALDLIRATSAILPFRRGGLAFSAAAPAVTVAREAIDGPQLALLDADPAITLEQSDDGGESWGAFVPTIAEMIGPSASKKK